MSDEKRLPLDPRTGMPLPASDHPGYYPGFSTLSQQQHWDAATREKVLKRVNHIPELRFFKEPKDSQLMQAILDIVMPQSDRTQDRQVPILNLIDERLYTKRFDGYIFEGMPEEDEAHRLGLQGVEELAQEKFKKAFVSLEPKDQEKILISIKDDHVDENRGVWKKMPAQHYWNVLISDATSAYYSHPYAWDEIGFGGPAYPRGYMRLTGGLAEPWEKDEKIYEWDAPAYSESNQFKDNEELFSKPSRHGEAGSH